MGVRVLHRERERERERDQEFLLVFVSERKREQLCFTDN